jgi:hypothetical protein
MSQEKVGTTGERWNELLGEDRDFFRAVVQEVFQLGQAAVIRPVLESFGETTVWDADGPRV